MQFATPFPFLKDTILTLPSVRSSSSLFLPRLFVCFLYVNRYLRRFFFLPPFCEGKDPHRQFLLPERASHLGLFFPLFLLPECVSFPSPGAICPAFHNLHFSPTVSQLFHDHLFRLNRILCRLLCIQTGFSPFRVLCPSFTLSPLYALPNSPWAQYTPISSPKGVPFGSPFDIMFKPLPISVLLPPLLSPYP